MLPADVFCKLVEVLNIEMKEKKGDVKRHVDHMGI
jgi:hypothetical protein